MSELTLNDLPQSFRDGIHHLQEECKTLSEDNSALRARVAELEAALTGLRRVVPYFWNDDNSHISELDEACEKADETLAKRSKP